MRIIFLDIDGVIVPVSAWWGMNSLELDGLRQRADCRTMTAILDRVDRQAVGRLQDLAQAAEACFVLHSSWRHSFREGFIRMFLEQAGLMDRFHPDWRCGPQLYKWTDIAGWLDGSDELVGPQDYIIIDDHALFETAFGPIRNLSKPQKAMKARQIRPDGKIGFSENDLAQALALFGLSMIERKQPEPISNDF